MLSLALIIVPVLVAAAPDGAALLARFECHRCHEGTGLTAITESRHCVRCHQAILEDRFEAPKEALVEWRPHLRSLRVVPSLAGIGNVLRREWVEAFLLAPQDLRPELPASMPRFRMSAEEASALARHLVPKESAGPVPSSAHVERGRALYEKHRCGDCHAFSGSGEHPRGDSPYRAMTREASPANPMALAPDLRFTRERLQPAVLRAWLENPRALRPDTLMPSLGLAPKEVDALASFVWHAKLELERAPASKPRLPVLERKVSYAEVEKRVFRKVCWHCHSSPDYNRGDGGPGNTGGLGFAARRLDLSSYEGVAAGLLASDGSRQSVFLPTENGLPRLLAVMLARRSEERGVVSELRGMPLGLPSMSDEQIQLVETWISQGRPR